MLCNLINMEAAEPMLQLHSIGQWAPPQVQGRLLMGGQVDVSVQIAHVESDLVWTPEHCKVSTASTTLCGLPASVLHLLLPCS